MSNAWTSNNGIVIRDLVPAEHRAAWIDRRWCPHLDLYSSFQRHVREAPEQPAVIDSAGVLDYAGLDRRVRGLAAALAEAHLGPRDIIGIRLPNGRAMVTAELAVAAIGAVALPYPFGRGSRDTLSLLGRSRASAAFFAAPEDVEMAARLPDLRAMFDAETEGSSPWEHRPVDPEAPARILVSSGSETEPKMVAYSHNAMLGGRANYVRALHDGDGPMRNLVLVPLASSMGSCGTSVTIAALGGTLLVMDSFDAAGALRMVTEHRPTQLWAVPTMLRRLADEPEVAGEDLGSLRAIVSSAGPVPESTADACRERLGKPIISVYGSADGVNCHTKRTGLGPESGTGIPDPTVAEIRIVGEYGQPLPVGEPGEIQARGPMTPLSYVADEELNARYRTETGWVRTGDRGMLDEQGRLHMLGRLKQIVKRGGYTISPAEVERELGTHPCIAEVACIGVPDDDLGERLCACVREVPGTRPLTLDEVTRYLERERGLERKKLPELVVRIPEMPLAPVGKICRNSLGTMVAEQLSIAMPQQRTAR